MKFYKDQRACMLVLNSSNVESAFNIEKKNLSFKAILKHKKPKRKANKNQNPM